MEYSLMISMAVGNTYNIYEEARARFVLFCVVMWLDNDQFYPSLSGTPFTNMD